MDSDEKDNDALFESENEDDCLSIKDSEEERGEYDEEQEPRAATQSEKMAAELDRGDSRDVDYIEGDGEFVEGDASPVLGSMVKELKSGGMDVVDCKVEDALDEDYAAFIQSLKVSGTADHIERELVKMPSHEDAVEEVKCARDDRCITLHPFGLEDFSNPKFLAALREKGCEEVRHQFVRPETNRDEWVGFVLLNFGSVSSALRAAEELKDFREGVEVKVQIQGSQSSRFNIRRWKAAVKGKHRWSDGLLMIKNIGESTSESKLSALFPGASILLHRESSPTSDGALNGFAYAVYAMKEEADEMLAKYIGKKITLDGRRLVVMRYFNPEKTVLPEGMLRLGERRLVMLNINELNEMISSANRDTTPLQNKVKDLQELIDKDDCIRQQSGLPTPSLDRLSKMSSLRQFSEREKTTILQRLLNPPPPPPPAPPAPPKPEAPKAENGEKSFLAKAGQSRKRKNRGKKSSTAVVSNFSTPPPVLPLLRPGFVPRLQIGELLSSLASAHGQPLRSPLLPPMLRGPVPTSLMRAPLSAKLQPPSLGNWMQPPPVGVPPPAIRPLGNTPVSRIPALVPPPAVPAPTGAPRCLMNTPPPRLMNTPPRLMNTRPPRLMNTPPPGLMNTPPPRPSPVPPPAPFGQRPQRSFSPGGMPPWRVPPPSGMTPRPLLRMPGEVKEPPLKMARFDRPPARPSLGFDRPPARPSLGFDRPPARSSLGFDRPPGRPILGSQPLPKFRPNTQQRRF